MLMLELCNTFPQSVLNLCYICALFVLHRFVEICCSRSHHICAGNSMAWHVCAVLYGEPLDKTPVMSTGSDWTWAARRAGSSWEGQWAYPPALLPETVETHWVTFWWLTVFLFDGNKTCPRIWLCSLAPWLNCCTIPKTGVFAEEGPENHPLNCIPYAVWFGVWICWSTIPLCSEVWIGRRFFRSVTVSDSCLHDLLPQLRDLEILSRLRQHTVYPIPWTKTDKCRSFIHLCPGEISII